MQSRSDTSWTILHSDTLLDIHFHVFRNIFLVILRYYKIGYVILCYGETFWDIMRIFAHSAIFWHIPRRSETFRDILRHSETFWNILRHSETFWDILRHSETFWDILRHSETFWDILRHSETFWDILRHSETFWDILRHSETFFWKEDFIRKSTKTKNYAIYKIYTYMYIPPPAVYTCTNTIHNT